MILRTGYICYLLRNEHMGKMPGIVLIYSVCVASHTSPGRYKVKKQVENTHLSQAVVAAQDAAAYDTNVKFLLADKQILARILKYTIKEFRNMDIQDIISCISDDIGVSSIPLEPGLTNLGRVKGDNTEDCVPGEGSIFFDIRFSAYSGETEMRFIVDLEAQRLTSHSSLGYYLENRIIYYIARMISAQKNTEFYGSDYDDIKNVRSIWICMDNGRKGDSIEEINLERKTVFGDREDPHNIELMQGIIINIRSNGGGEVSRNTLISMLETLLSRMDVEEKKSILEKKYGMIMSVEIEGRMQKMCNLSEGILEEGWTKGILKRSQQVILDLLEDLGDIPEDISDRINGEEDLETLRRWHKAAARTESFPAFREIMATACGS